jgi:uncharacterized protein (DUF3084 family)
VLRIEQVLDMVSGYILVTVVLFLGGIIAVSGDRIGSKVGKARLTLFKLRPRQTATLVTVAAGTFLSASVLAVLFASSEQLRTGIFDLQRLQGKLSSTSAELAQAITQKNNFQRDLEKLRIEQSEAKDALSGINQSVRDELTKRSSTAQQLSNLRQQLETVGRHKNTLKKEVDETTRKIEDLNTQQIVLKKQKSTLLKDVDRATAKLNKLIEGGINLESIESSAVDPNLRATLNLQQSKVQDLTKQLQSQAAALQKIESQYRQLEQKLEMRKAQLKEKERQFTQIDQELTAVIEQQQKLDRQFNQLEGQLKDRERRMASIDREISDIEREYQNFRQGSIVILRNQVMVLDVVSVTPQRSAQQIISQLLKQANQAALVAMKPRGGKDLQVVKMSAYQEQQIMEQIKDGKQYVVRLFAVSNYVNDDPTVEIFADAALNQKVFSKGEVLAFSFADPTKMNDRQLRQQVDLLLSSCQFRARRGGILGDSIEIGVNGDMGGLLLFLEQIKNYHQPLNSGASQVIDIKAVAANDINTAGPIKIKLQAWQGGRIIFE